MAGCYAGIDVDNYWGASEGTSLSCPQVAGIALLILQARPELTPSMVRDIITSTATAANGDTHKGKYG